MEAAAKALKSDGKLMLREGLSDEHHGVRFAACMGLGDLALPETRDAIAPLVKDPDASVRVAAYFALERLGDASHRVAWRDALVHDPNPVVRRNAVMALGRLNDKHAMSLLWKAAAGDGDEGVRIQAIEALAGLGDTQAINRLIHDAYGAIAYKQPFALLSMSTARDDRVVPALRTRLQSAPYIEARLAAARSLGAQGNADGYQLALQSLTWNQPRFDTPDDPPANQVMRVRTMAAMALGEIHEQGALGPLAQVMRDPQDARVQVAAATAILMILNSQESAAVSGLRRKG
jgi:HEAT repeat protein